MDFCSEWKSEITQRHLLLGYLFPNLTNKSLYRLESILYLTGWKEGTHHFYPPRLRVVVLCLNLYNASHA